MPGRKNGSKIALTTQNQHKRTPQIPKPDNIFALNHQLVLFGMLTFTDTLTLRVMQESARSFTLPRMAFRKILPNEKPTLLTIHTHGSTVLTEHNSWSLIEHRNGSLLFSMACPEIAICSPLIDLIDRSALSVDSQGGSVVTCQGQV
jgi:isopenicillin N synthase-like dioxygenase